MVTVLVWFATMLQAYLLGGMATGVVVSKWIYHDDVRAHGSGATGMTNMLRTFGKKAAALTALGDVLKGVLAVLIGRWLFALSGQPVLFGMYVASIFAVLGHWKPLLFGFKGGKGVLVAAGGLLAVRPILIPGLAVVFFALFLPSRMVSLGSIGMAVCYPVFTALYGALWLHLPTDQLIFSTVCAVVIGGLVVYMHRANIQRILSGTEYRFDGKHKKE